LQAEPESGAQHRAENSEREPLNDVDRKTLPRARTQTPKDGDRVDLLPHVDVDRARDPDRPEKQRDEAHEIQEAFDIGQRRAEIPFSFRDGGILEAFAQKPHPHFALNDLRIPARRQFHEHPMPGDTLAVRQPRGLERAKRNERARRERRNRRRLSRHVFQRAGDREDGLPEFYRIADFYAELREQRLLQNHDLFPRAQLGGGIRRHRFKFAEERKIRLDRTHLNEPGGVIGRLKNKHRGKLPRA
jgi:hypothetical protein